MRVKSSIEGGEVIIECIIDGSGQTIILLRGWVATQIKSKIPCRLSLMRGFAPSPSIRSDLTNGNPFSRLFKNSLCGPRSRVLRPDGLGISLV
jgi:hypothetical protein